jgi:poly(beta-D-mannuronate) lyase
MLIIASAASAKTFLVHNEQEFKSAAAQAAPGDMITIANGIYTPWMVSIAANGTAAKPIIIKAETISKVIFSGDVEKSVFEISGSYITFSGITFSGCNLLKTKSNGLLVEVKNAKHCRLTDCLFTKNTVKAQFMPLVMISGQGEYNQVDHCSFIGNIDNQELQVRITKESCPQYTLIHHNIFKDKPRVSWKVFNGGECVQVGQDPVMLGIKQANTTVRENQFIRCNGEGEVISNKSSSNKYIKNTFEDCDGELVMRGGHDCLIDSNTIKGGHSGIRVNGTGHIISNNTISNVKTGIRLMYGMGKGKAEVGFYIAASDCLIKNNRIENATTGILIGDSKGEDWTGKFDTTKYPSRTLQDVAPFNNKFVGNVFVGVQTEKVEQ